MDADLLAQLALSCRDSERIRFGYTAASGRQSSRSAEPHILVPQGRRWYLVAWDLARTYWRTFRLDRIQALQQTRVMFPPRDLTPAAQTAWPITSDHLAGLATDLLWIPDTVPYTVEASAEVLGFLRDQADRVRAALG
ncbi:helix-turn-helix transcriptional regulator [Cryobacterium adonitolivorans]|uniref:helix-turn-helix transcriptional regulator n=1 Tax=Cryobacterium adonitolivorans TaxID=1259189 RepID=UPI0018E0ACAA|nr:WYL domain-containing protein [Cryobacterium adonitolivorans]